MQHGGTKPAELNGGLHQLLPLGFQDRLGLAGHAELAVDMVQVRAHRPHGNIELCGYLLGCNGGLQARRGELLRIAVLRCITGRSTGSQQIPRVGGIPLCCGVVAVTLQNLI